MPDIMSLGMCFKKLHLIKVGAFAWYNVKNSRYFWCPIWKTKSW